MKSRLGIFINYCDDNYVQASSCGHSSSVHQEENQIDLTSYVPPGSNVSSDLAAQLSKRRLVSFNRPSLDCNLKFMNNSRKFSNFNQKPHIWFL